MVMVKSDLEDINALAFSRQKVLVPVKVHMGDDDARGVEPMPMKQIPSSGENDEDVEINITGCSNLGKAFVVEDSCEDATECSSSFDDTGSGIENASAFSDTEVESWNCAGDPSSSMCDDWSELCQERNKKMTKNVTIHWKKFIRPIAQRCKWIELRVKQLQSQAHKYETELAAYNYTKQLDFAHLTSDDSSIKSVPMSGWMRRNKVMKRNRRKRVEEKCDMASYMSNHSLFSYYEKTDCTADTHSKDFGDVGIGGVSDSNEEFKQNDEWSSGEYEDIDKSLDDIIQKIEAVQSQVQQLKTRTETVICENRGKSCSVTQLSMHEPSDGFNHFDQKSTSFAGNGNTIPFSFPQSSTHLQSDFHTEDLLMHGSAPASREGIIPCIETTSRPGLYVQVQTKNGVFIQNQEVKEELHDFKYDGNGHVERTKESIEEDKFISKVQVSEPDSPEIAVHNEHSNWISCSTLKPLLPNKNKRKRVMKFGSRR